MLQLSSRPLFALFLLGCLLILLGPGAGCATAADSEPALSQPLMAAWYSGVLGNQKRMIQVTLVCFVIGVFFLSWGKK